MHKRQRGFKPKKNTHQHIKEAINLRINAKELKQKNANQLFIDFKKALDSIDHEILKEKIKNKIL